jgi:hypothetical protein
MGSGGLAVDAMTIGCLGVERRVERFFSYLTILTRCVLYRPNKNQLCVKNLPELYQANKKNLPVRPRAKKRPTKEAKETY